MKQAIENFLAFTEVSECGVKLCHTFSHTTLYEISLNRNVQAVEKVTKHVLYATEPVCLICERHHTSQSKRFAV